MVVKLTPKWDDSGKAGNDKTGWKRGAIGIDGAFDKDGELFMRTFDPEADDKMYGKNVRNRRPDGAQRVTCNASRDIGNLHDTFKGYSGVDGDGGTQ